MALVQDAWSLALRPAGRADHGAESSQAGVVLAVGVRSSLASEPPPKLPLHSLPSRDAHVLHASESLVVAVDVQGTPARPDCRG